MRNRERNRTQVNPDIASTTDELKANYAQPSVIPPEANKDKTRRVGHLPLMLGAGATAIAVVTGGYFALEGKSKPSPQGSGTENSGVVNPGENDPIVKTPELDGLSAAELGNDTEAIVNEYYRDLNQFFITGASKESASADERYTMSDSEYVDKISVDINASFIDTYFVPNWGENPNLVEYVADMMSNAKITRWARIGTYGGGTGNIEPYECGYVLEDIEPSNDPLSASTRWKMYDNRDMNMADEGSLTGVDPNTLTGGDTITWIKVGDKLKIEDVTYNGE